MSIHETDPVAIAINQLTRDPGPGEVLCRWHLIQRAVNPDTGKYTAKVPMQSNWGPVVIDGNVVDAPVVNAPSSIGVCEECWREQHSGFYTNCPLHGTQPRGTSERCVVCEAAGTGDADLLVANGEGFTVPPEDEEGGVLEADGPFVQPNQKSDPAPGEPASDRDVPDGESAPGRGGRPFSWFGS